MEEKFKSKLCHVDLISVVHVGLNNRALYYSDRVSLSLMDDVKKIRSKSMMIKAINTNKNLHLSQSR